MDYDIELENAGLGAVIEGQLVPIDREYDVSRPVGAFAAYRVERVHARLTAQGGAILAREAGLTLRQWWVIADIVETKATTATELSELTDVDKGLLSRNLKALGEAGLVSVTKDPTDMRRHFIALTEKGQDLYRKTLPVMNQRNAHLTANVEQEEYEVFLRVLDKIETAAHDTSVSAYPSAED